MMVSNKKVKVRRRTDKEMEHSALVEEQVSIFCVCLVVILCLIVGVSTGIFLYDMALNNGSMFVVNIFNLLF